MLNNIGLPWELTSLWVSRWDENKLLREVRTYVDAGQIMRTLWDNEIGVGEGWAYTIVALIGFATTPLLLWTAKNGIRWRKEAKEKDLEKTNMTTKVKEEKLLKDETQTKNESKERVAMTEAETLAEAKASQDRKEL